MQDILTIHITVEGCDTLKSPRGQINMIRFGGFCDCDFDGKYELGHSAYALMSMFAAIFFTTENGRKAVNSVTKNYPA